MQVCSHPSSPRGQGTAPSFIGQGEAVYNHAAQLQATHGGMVYNTMELLIILANLTSGRCRGESCACPGVVSRVVVWEPLVWLSSVRQLEG
jgi:hypothetical protein